MFKPSSLVWIFTTSLLVGFSGAMTPGPLLFVNITESARAGFWAGPSVATGHAFMELIAVLLLGLGLNRVVQRSMVAGTIGVAGGLVLVWMGAQTVLSAPSLSLSATLGHRGEALGLGPFLYGALASVANPYWIIWWATVGAGYMVRSLQQGLAGVAAFYAGHILSDYSWYSFVAFMIATGRRLLSDMVYQGVLIACGGFLIWLGILFTVSGVRFWRGRPPALPGSPAGSS